MKRVPRPRRIEPELPPAGRPDWAGDAPSYYHAWAEAKGRPAPERSSLTQHRHCEVAVVGGGLTGTSAALALAERGYEVVLLDRDRVGDGASGRNGGQLVTGFNCSMATLERRQGKADARMLWDLALAGRELAVERAERLGLPAHFQRGYAIPASGRLGRRNLEAVQADWARYGYQTQLLTGAETRAIVDSPSYDSVLLDDSAGHLDPLALTRGFAEAAEARGAGIYEHSPVAAVDPHERRAVLADGTELTADWLILAGNTGQLGLHPELARGAFSVPTFMLATEPLSPERAARIIPANRAVSEDTLPLHYYRFTPDNRLLLGGEVALTGEPPSDVGERLLAATHRLFPQLSDVGAAFWWGGQVDIAPLRVPSFYRLGPRCLALQGFSGQGLALTTIAGAVAAEAVAGDSRRFDAFARIRQPRLPAGVGRTLTLRLGFLGHWALAYLP